jgi:hypothetical protein
MATSSQSKVPPAVSLEPVVGEKPATARPAPAGVARPPRPGAPGALLIPAGRPLPAAQRLVVLVPDAMVDEAHLAAFIWALAAPQGLEVLLLGTPRRLDEQYRARRRLASIAAITRDDHVRVSSELISDKGWLAAVRQVWRPGDLVVCHAELTSARGLRRRPLAPALVQALQGPVYVAAGLYPDLPHERRGWLAQASAWLPPVAIILGFLALQARLTAATSGGVQTVLLALSVMAEFALIAAWEHFLGTLL